MNEINAAIDAAMHRALIFYITRIVLLAIMALIAWILSMKKEKLKIFAITLPIFLIVYCAAFFAPFLKDYASSDFVKVEGTYKHFDGKSKSGGSPYGIYTVTIEAEGEKLVLSTIPITGKNFPEGEHQVVAWYTRNPKYLVHIEIIGSRSASEKQIMIPDLRMSGGRESRVLL